MSTNSHLAESLLCVQLDHSPTLGHWPCLEAGQEQLLGFSCKGEQVSVWQLLIDSIN